MTSTPPPAIELDFFMQGVGERVNEKEMYHLLEHRKGNRQTQKSKLVLRRSLKNPWKIASSDCFH